MIAFSNNIHNNMLTDDQENVFITIGTLEIYL